MGKLSERQGEMATRHRCRVRNLGLERPTKGSEDGVHILILFGIRSESVQEEVYFSSALLLAGT